MKQSKYWIEKNRYYELKFFCLQYPDWKKRIKDIDYACLNLNSIPSGYFNDPVLKIVEARDWYQRRIDILDAVNKHCCTNPIVFKSIIKGISYKQINSEIDSDLYFLQYQKFFWFLNKTLKEEGL